MKLRQMIPQQKLKATPVRRTNASTRAAAMDEEEEPTMRLSTAFVVVLLLHLVAIGGVYTFDAVKVNRFSKGEATAETNAAAAVTQAPVSPAAALANAGQEPAKVAPAANAEPASQKVAAATSTKTAAAPAKSAPAPASGPASSGKIHTVQKGENPVVIARQYGVDYDALLTLNKIEDPRRLRIGQKLQIPVK